MSGTLNKVGGALNNISNRTYAAGERMAKMGKTMIRTGAEMAAPAAAVGFGLYEAVKTAGDFQGEMAHVATAVKDGADSTKHLAEAQKLAETTSMHSIHTQKQLMQAYYMARSNGLQHRDALEAVTASTNLVIGTTENAAQADAQLATTTRTLTDLHNNYGGSLTRTADQLSKLQTSFGFKDISEITDALTYIAPSAQGAGVSIEQMMAGIAVMSENMKHGSEAGTVFRNVLMTIQRGGAAHRLDPFIRQTKEGKFALQESMQALIAYLNTLGGDQARTSFLIHAGFQARAIDGIRILLKHQQRFADIGKSMFTAQGAALENANIRMKAFDYQWDTLGNNIENLKIALGQRLLPSLTGGLIPALQNAVGKMITFVQAGKLDPILDEFQTLISDLIAVLSWTGRFIAEHPGFTTLAMKVGAVSLAFSGLAGIASIAFGSTFVLVGNLIKAASYLPTLARGIIYVTEAMTGWRVQVAIQEGAAALMAAWGWIVTLPAKIGLVTAATRIWTAVQLALDAASLPLIVTIGTIAAAAALLAAAAYEIYNHWNVIGPFFVRLWAGVKKTFSAVVGWMKTTGADMMKALASGMMSAIMWPYKAGEAIGEKLGKLFKFHSPPSEGPIREAIENFRFSEELAKRMSVAPVIRPAYALAGAAAAAVPMMRSPSAMSGGSPGMHSGGIVINLNYSVNGATPRDFDPQRNADQILRIVRSRLEREQRLSFS